MTKLTDSLYVGSVEESFNLSNDIKSVLNVASEIDIEYRLGRVYKKIAVNDDDPNEDITIILPACMEFIKANKPTFVHCLEGKSRSVIVCLCYMVLEEGYTLNTSIKIISSNRDIDIFPTYLNQLQLYLKN